MEVILFLLKAITKLALALTGLAVALVTFTLGKLTGHLTKEARQPAPQQEPRPATRPSQQVLVPTPVTASPTVHVHVHIDQAVAQAAPMPMSIPAPSAHSGNGSPTTVLNRPDHRIYVTTGSHLMTEHPTGDGLLERLDAILYHAAFRDGDPFTVAPPLDDARHGGAVLLELPPVAPIDEDEFCSTEQHPLPLPDNALWFRKAGEAPRQLATGTP